MAVENLMRSFIEAGGSPYFVGGKVRDAYMGKPNEDNDIVVFGLPFEAVKAVAEQHGTVTLTVVDGTGVLKVNIGSEIVDIILPRRERSTGEGDNDFTFEIDHTMSPQEERERADFTMNAMLMDVNGNILDFFGGMQDIDRRVIRHINPVRFVESPVRGLRAARFAARFGFTVAIETAGLISTMDFNKIAKERVFAEFEKMFKQAKRPSNFIRVLVESGWLDSIPVLANMRLTQQDPEWHPEGNVLIHTMHVMDEMARIAPGDVVLGFAGMLHDCGKPLATEVRNGKIVSPRHAHIGHLVANQFMRDLKAPVSMIMQVTCLVDEHMRLLDVPVGNTRAVRRLVHDLGMFGVTIEQWAKLVEADASGRPPLPKHAPGDKYVEIARTLYVDQPQGEKPIITGKHLKELGFVQGKELGAMHKAAFQAQLDEEFSTVEEGMNWVRNQMGSA